MLFFNGLIDIPESELSFSFARSSGPGGQNVNKVNSKALLRWNIFENRTISENLRAKLIQKLSPQLTLAGEILITSDRYRDQVRNRQDGNEKLNLISTKALFVEKPRKKTAPTFSSRKRRLTHKSRHSEKKQARRKTTKED